MMPWMCFSCSSYIISCLYSLTLYVTVSGSFRFAERMECFFSWIPCESEFYFLQNLSRLRGFLGNLLLVEFILKYCSSQAILPYTQALEKLAPHIQQVYRQLHGGAFPILKLLDLCISYLFDRLAWRVMEKEYPQMVCAFLLKLVKLILVNQEQMDNIVFTN